MQFESRETKRNGDRKIPIAVKRNEAEWGGRKSVERWGIRERKERRHKGVSDSVGFVEVGDTPAPCRRKSSLCQREVGRECRFVSVFAFETSETKRNGDRKAPIAVIRIELEWGGRKSVERWGMRERKERRNKGVSESVGFVEVGDTPAPGRRKSSLCQREVGRECRFVSVSAF
ncbi:MAG: hypothetical protein J6K95_00655, partial [Rikenellaceae bacterium]|nr:hypothetical protein [Rikenellaceae bacterium]